MPESQDLRPAAWTPGSSMASFSASNRPQWQLAQSIDVPAMLERRDLGSQPELAASTGARPRRLHLQRISSVTTSAIPEPLLQKGGSAKLTWMSAVRVLSPVR